MKYTSLLLIVLFTFGLSACGDKPATQDEHGKNEAAGEHSEANEAAEAEPVKGEHGGRLLKQDGYALELKIHEDGVPPEYRVWLYRDNKILPPTAGKVEVHLARLGNIKDIHIFKAQDDYLRSDAEVYEPQGPMRSVPRCENGAVGAGGSCTKSRFVETLPEGRSHDVLNIDVAGPGDNTEVFTVPEGQYFFMGDNRDNSQDSRFAQAAGGVGFVPAEYLIGRADRIIFSSAGSRMLYFWTWRSDRYFQAVE